MPLPSLHPLPNNPTTGQAPSASLRNGVPPASAAGGGGVSRETLKGLQDVYWSDDEDDPDCLLCAEPLDLSDLNFKPCQCGMQICQFCYNKLLTTDSRCPGCRRPYDAKAVVFQPVDWEEVKRAKEKKTRRAKTIKQLTSMGRRHLLGVRVVMKNMVYVVGMKIPGGGDEAISILRSHDYFGQYGKISKLYLRERTNSSSVTPLDVDTAMGIYIVYVRREDAARAILALDGIPSPQGPAGQVLRATYGTTRYCDAFLKGQKCDNQGCTALHEWGGESDCFTKDDFELALIRPAEYDARQKQAQVTAPPMSQKASWPKPSSVDDAIAGSSLPSSAAWGKGIPIARPAPRSAAPIGTSRPIKPPTSVVTALPLKSNIAFPLPTPSPVQPPPVKEKKEKKEKASAMIRGRSTDSSMSATTSSAQVSPKRKPAALAPVSTSTAATATSTKAPPPPPPGLSAPPSSTTTPIDPKPLGTSSTVETPADIGSDEQQDASSAESEAGPSSASPAPQTPARLSDHLPPPLTDEPIFVHSPYEEPSLYPFPLSDPEFAFVLGLDPDEVQRYTAETHYQPSPFSKTLVGLAELGILAPEIPDLASIPHHRESFSGTFQPFESVEDEIEDEAGPSSGVKTPPRARPTQEEEDWEVEGPRTTSRFDFARPSSRATSGRGQSPFALTRSQRDDRDEWRAAQGQADAFGHGQALGHAPVQQGHALMSGYGAAGGPGQGEWGMSSTHDSPFSARDGAGRYKRERDDYDAMRYAQSSHQLFSPDAPSSSALDDFNSHLPSHSHSHAHAHSHAHTLSSPAHHTSAPPGFMHPSQTQAQHAGSPLYDPRTHTLGHYNSQSQRPQSPTPLSQGHSRSRVGR